MRIPKTIKQAVNNYYAFQGKGFKHSSSRYAETSSLKQDLLKRIDVLCTNFQIGFCAAAGGMWFTKGKQKFHTCEPFLDIV